MTKSWLIEEVLTIHDVKSGFRFFSFFLVIYIIGKCLLNSARCLWDWLVFSAALTMFCLPPDNVAMLQQLILKLEGNLLGFFKWWEIIQKRSSTRNPIRKFIIHSIIDTSWNKNIQRIFHPTAEQTRERLLIGLSQKLIPSLNFYIHIIRNRIHYSFIPA